MTLPDSEKLAGKEFWKLSNYLEVCTPKNAVRDNDKLTDRDNILVESTFLEDIPNEQQFDIIVKNVNQTISELNQVYNKIGYTSAEINTKKSEIFTAIQETINTFATSLHREKNNVENECEWLKQQIQVILAMIDDPQGIKHLSLLERGLLFNDSSMYHQGYKIDLKERLAKKQNFYVSSPFNVSRIDDEENQTVDDLSLQQQFDYMSKNIPEASLIILKTKLNGAFLTVLKAFVKLFTKLNEMCLEFLEISSHLTLDSSSKTINSLPKRDEAETHRDLVLKFDELIKLMGKNDGNVNTESYKNNEAFILSSPRRPTTSWKLDQQLPINGVVGDLRNINYQIVQVIRSLKFTKITPDLLNSLQLEIQKYRDEVEIRSSNVSKLITECLEHIDQLQINDEQLIKLQKHHKLTHDANDEDYFEIETLNFIKTNPQQFGLNDSHILFINRFASLLQKIKESKEKKKNNYLKHCYSLWEKLGENEEYINNFLHENSLLTDESLMNFKMELNKLYMKRSEFIDSFITDTRNEIESLWQKMHYSIEQRMKFEFYSYDNMTDTTEKEMILSIHEKELSKLKELYELQEPIFKLYAEFNELLEDQAFLRESSKDSSRLLSKNSCKILLNEEKIRKKLSKNMPRLISALKSEISKYNNQALRESKQPIQVNGEDFFERVLILESELGRPNSQSRNNNHISPTRSNPSIKPKPSQSSQPARQPKRFSPLKSSPTKERLISKPVFKRPSEKFTNSTKIRLTNALNSSLSSNSSISSLESPRTVSVFEQPITNPQLIPLNSPLELNHTPNDRNRTLKSIDENSSPLKRLPLQANNNIANKPNLSMKRQTSFAKENLSPAMYSPGQYAKKIHFDSNTRKAAHEDSSGILEADFQSWRAERIKQMNK